MQEEFYWGTVLKIWWAMAWRSFAIMFAFGTVLMTAMLLAGSEAQKAKTIMEGIVNLLSIPLSIYMLKFVLNKKHKTFTIHLEKHPPQPAPEPPPSQQL